MHIKLVIPPWPIYKSLTLQQGLFRCESVKKHVKVSCCLLCYVEDPMWMTVGLVEFSRILLMVETIFGADSLCCHLHYMFNYRIFLLHDYL